MFVFSMLSTANYDALLNGWDAQTLHEGVVFDGGDSTYCTGKAARGHMISHYDWAITDGGLACTEFIIMVKTDNPGTSSSKQFTIPTKGSGYNYNVDCNNDGTNEAKTRTKNYTCSYASPGTYTIRISDNTGSGTGFPRIFLIMAGIRLNC